MRAALGAWQDEKNGGVFHQIHCQWLGVKPLREISFPNAGWHDWLLRHCYRAGVSRNPTGRLEPGNHQFRAPTPRYFDCRCRRTVTHSCSVG